MDDSTPIWCLDVDGVINAPKPGWSAPPKTRYAYADGLEWRIRWAPALMDKIRNLHLSGKVEVRWCTTWCDYADQLEKLFYLPQLKRTLNGKNIYIWDKYKVVAEALLEGNKVIWTDDEAGYYKDDDVIADYIDSGKLLLIAPKPGKGLQPEDIKSIEAFI